MATQEWQTGDAQANYIEALEKNNAALWDALWERFDTCPCDDNPTCDRCHSNAVLLKKTRSK